MDNQIAFLARNIARDAGYDPDQLVVDIDHDRDFDLLHIGLAPVDITKIKPIFMKFYNEAERRIKEGNITSKGYDPSLSIKQGSGKDFAV